jgi:hypothetical protein
MRTGRISAIAAAGVMAAGALTVFAGTGTASAASYSALCVDSTTGYGTECADSELGTGAGNWIITLPYGTSSLTNWTYPTGSTPTAIRQADNVNYCMQVDETGADSGPANFEVIGAGCNNDEAEMWWNVYDPTSKRTLFESEWAYYNLDEQLCLTYGPGYGDPAGLFAVPCNFSGNTSYWWQQWGTS